MENSCFTSASQGHKLLHTPTEIWKHNVSLPLQIIELASNTDMDSG